MFSELSDRRNNASGGCLRVATRLAHLRSDLPPKSSSLPQTESWSQMRQPSGDSSAVAPPVPIPNTEVKRCSPDDSASIGCAKVGRRQSFCPASWKQGAGHFFCNLNYEFCEWSVIAFKTEIGGGQRFSIRAPGG